MLPVLKVILDYQKFFIQELIILLHQGKFSRIIGAWSIIGKKVFDSRKKEKTSVWLYILDLATFSLTHFVLYQGNTQITFRTEN